jgi:8-oxo-dGTP pyrophosphatase MutT (NUDIX family)
VTSSEPARARVVLVEDGRLALIKRVRAGRTYYIFPGGGVEPGETPAQAAVREAHEELGVDVEIRRVVHEEVVKRVRFVFFEAQITGGEFGTGLWPDHANLDELERQKPAAPRRPPARRAQVTVCYWRLARP